MNRIGIGIIGAGYFGEKHAEALASQPNARLVASNRTNAVALGEFTRRYGGRGYLDYQDLLDDKEVDAVVIATPHHLHTDIAVDAANAGKHILLEKPLAGNLEDCDRILNSARTNGIVFMAGMINHFIPAYSAVQQMLTSGKMGELVMAFDKTLKPWWAPNRREWHLNRTTGGGMWMTIGVHGVDRLNWLTSSHVCTVSASIGTYFHDQSADDGGVAFLRYQNGVAGTVVTAGYREGTPEFETELICTQGLLKIDKSKGAFIGKNNSWTHLPGSASSNWMEDALIEEWRAFLSSIETRSEPPISLEFSRHVMEVMFAAEESALQNREVAL
jgi:phthalate 4,5-cis-dihydrodiol dehydrogenase